jgi:hypothetical protein
VYSLRYGNGQVTDLTEWTVDLDPPGFQRILFPAAIVEDPAGELYIVDYQATGGGIWKLVPEPPASSVAEAPPGTIVRLSPGVPNPFRASVRWEVTLDASGTGTTEAKVVDVAGRAVRTLHLPASSGPASIEWDGKDDAGRGAASGVYFLRVTSGGETRTRGVTRLR